jgi:hypothetical protein
LSRFRHLCIYLRLKSFSVGGLSPPPAPHQGSILDLPRRKLWLHFILYLATPLAGPLVCANGSYLQFKFYYGIAANTVTSYLPHTLTVWMKYFKLYESGLSLVDALSRRTIKYLKSIYGASIWIIWSSRPRYWYLLRYVCNTSIGEPVVKPSYYYYYWYLLVLQILENSGRYWDTSIYQYLYQYCRYWQILVKYWYYQYCVPV